MRITVLAALLAIVLTLESAQFTNNNGGLGSCQAVRVTPIRRRQFSRSHSKSVVGRSAEALRAMGRQKEGFKTHDA